MNAYERRVIEVGRHPSFFFLSRVSIKTQHFSRQKKVEGTLMFAIGKEDQGACISKPDMVYTLISFATE